MAALLWLTTPRLRHITSWQTSFYFRLAAAGDVIPSLCIAYTLLLYNLFTPVSRSLSVLAAFFSLVGSGIAILNTAFEVAPLVILKGAQSLSAFNVEQLQALALLFLKLHAQVYDIGLVLFGTYNLLIGYLILRSTFVPRILGVLLAVSGLCYLINSFANFVSPAFAANLCLTFWCQGRGTAAGAVARGGWYERPTTERAGQPNRDTRPGTMRWEHEPV